VVLWRPEVLCLRTWSRTPPAGEVWGYVRPSPAQPPARQVELLRSAGVPLDRLLVDDGSVRKHRPQLRRFHDDAVTGKMPVGSVLVVATLDRLGLTVRETTLLVRELHEHGVRVRTLADVVDIDTTPPLTPTAELTLGVLGLVEEAEATYTRERVEVARGVAAGKGERLGRARQVDQQTLAEALRLYDEGVPVAQIEERVNITRSAFYRLAARERGGPVGVRRRRRPGLPEEVRAGLLDLKGKVSMRRAAALYEVSHSTVHSLWREQVDSAVPPRHSGTAPSPTSPADGVPEPLIR
jgi:DNA invertase Pin-like site-specific DNA recombinase